MPADFWLIGSCHFARRATTAVEAVQRLSAGDLKVSTMSTRSRISQGNNTTDRSSGLVVRPIRGDIELEDVRRLTYRAYRACGLVDAQPDGRLVYCSHLDCIPETTVFVAVENREIVGTLTITFDNPGGFHLTSEYEEAVQGIRDEGRELACSWRLAVRQDYQRNMRVMNNLVRANIQHAVINGIETCLFTVLPRLVRVYERLLHFEVVGSKQNHGPCKSEELSKFHCETVLMRWDLERCPRSWWHRWFPAASATQPAMPSTQSEPR